MNKKIKTAIMITTLLSTCIPITQSYAIPTSQDSANRAVEQKDKEGGVVFRDYMDYKDSRKLYYDETQEQSMNDMFDKIKSRKESGQWRLNGDEMKVDGKTDKLDDNNQKSKTNDTSEDPGNRVSDNVYEIAKSMGVGVFPLQLDGKQVRYSSMFGERHVRNGSKYHKGIDVGRCDGFPILSMYDGTVIEARTRNISGNFVVISHKNGVMTEYFHMKYKPKVQKGEKVSAGQVIGYVGGTGGNKSYPPHLHFGVKVKGLPDNGYVNPYYGFIDPNKFPQGSGPGYGGLDQKKPKDGTVYNLIYK